MKVLTMPEVLRRLTQRSMGRRSIVPIRLIGLSLIVVAMLVLLVGCGSEISGAGKLVGGSITGGQIEKTESGTLQHFDVTLKQAGDPLGLDFRGTLTQGDLWAQLTDNNGKTIWEGKASQGTYVVATTLTNLSPGEYHLGLRWQGACKASYDLVWRPSDITASHVTTWALLPGLGMLIVGLGFILFSALSSLGWGYLGLGALMWVITVALKFAWAMPANPPIYQAVTAAVPGDLGIYIVSLYVGALTGIFEVAIAYLLFRFTRLGRAPWKSALAFGIGFGAIEAILLSVSPLIAAFMALTAPSTLPPAALDSLVLLNNPLQGFAPVWERFFTIWVHVACNVLLFYAIAVKKPLYFWLSFLNKTLIDAIAGFAQLSWLGAPNGLDPLTRLWIIEAIVALWGIVGWWATTRVRAHYPEQPDKDKQEETPKLAPQ